MSPGPVVSPGPEGYDQPVRFDELMKQIQEGGEFDTREHAQAAAQAVLPVLGERLAGSEPAHLAAQLPRELADAVWTRGPGDPFGIDEFDRRVAEREELACTPVQAHRHAMVVLSAVLGSISPGERQDVVAQLPAEYADLVA